MKKVAAMLVLFSGCLGASAMASPFRTRFVCMPRVVASEWALEFRVRDRGQCSENETYMEVKAQGDGSTLLLPATDSLSPEEQRDLENYRKFFGGSSPPGAGE
ncbi:MAG: hypothetical protein IT572_06645 [Deltaproteobacteria bacterium]|nr:hypothetical protein [Deltaproteobacteria bacterium]